MVPFDCLHKFKGSESSHCICEYSCSKSTIFLIFILQYLNDTADNLQNLRTKLNDFGFRSSTCVEVSLTGTYDC